LIAPKLVVVANQAPLARSSRRVSTSACHGIQDLSEPRQAANLLQGGCSSFHPPAFSLYQRHGLCTGVTWLSLITLPCIPHACLYVWSEPDCPLAALP